MDDLISRQAAIDALDRIFDRCEEIEAHLPEGDPDRTGYKMYPDYMTVWKYLRQLPSAQPEIIVNGYAGYADGFADGYKQGQKDAQPERKTGKWELLPLSIIPPVYKCSACGRHAVWITTGCLVNRHEESYLSDFCPNCGADMRGE